MGDSTIQLTGGDYSTIALFEADTDNDLVTAAEGETGRMSNELLYNGSATAFSMNGATTNASFFRRLEPQGDNYDPINDDGPRVISSSLFSVGDSSEDFAEFLGLGVTSSGVATGGGSNAISFNSDNGLWDSCTIRRTAATNGSGMSTPNSAITISIRNSIFIGTGGSGSGQDGLKAEASNLLILNNVFYDWSGRGIDYRNKTYDGTNVLENNISMSNGGGGFDLSHGSINNDFNCSSDGTATGTNSIINQTLADIFENAGSDIFRLKSGSNAIDAGVSQDFTLDIIKATHGSSGTWEMGAYDFAVAAGGDINPLLAVSMRRLRSRILRM